MEIESVLIRLRETTAEINRATDDPGIKASLEQTWLLQDRLVFPNQVRYFMLEFWRPLILLGIACHLQEYHSFTWADTFVWRFTRLLANQRRCDRSIHGLTPL